MEYDLLLLNISLNQVTLGHPVGQTQILYSLAIDLRDWQAEYDLPRFVSGAVKGFPSSSKGYNH